MKQEKILVHCRYTTHHMAIRKVIHGLVSNLKNNDKYKYVLAVNKNNSVDFDQYLFETIQIPCHSDNALLNHAFNLFLLPILCVALNVKIVVFPQISFFIATFAKKIVFMHDLIEYKLKNQKKHKHIARQIFFPWVANRSDRIITVSQNSANDLNVILGVDLRKIKVAYDGVDHITKFDYIDKSNAKKFVSEKYKISDYIFYVGYISEPQKNLIYMVESIGSYIKKSGDELELVFAGPLGLNSDKVFQRADDLGLKYKYLGKVPEIDLANLFKAASLFCFPSKYEGFGMPVAEALAMGVPVITSNTSSLPEVAGGAAELVNPNSIEDLENAISKIRKDPDLRDLMIKNGKVVASRYTWKKFAEIVESVIQEELKK